MTQTIELTGDTKIRFDFFACPTIRGRIEIKRKARKDGHEELARELEEAGYVPKTTN